MRSGRRREPRSGTSELTPLPLFSFCLQEGLLAVQTVRNMIISVALLATAESALLSTMLNLLTDPQRLEQMQLFALQDPLTGGEPLLSPAVKVGLALATLFLSFLTFAACVRLAVHLSFLIRVIPNHPAINLPLREETILLMQRASLYFTVGLRMLYAFVPLAFYMATGPTAFLVATALVLVALLALDTVPARQVDHLLRASTMANIEAGLGVPPKVAAAMAESVQGGGLPRQGSSISTVADGPERKHHRWHITS